MKSTIKIAARNALQCQDACNLSGVLFTFARDMQAVCDESNRLEKGTDWKNQHAVVILYLDKLAQLAGGWIRWDGVALSEAIDECTRLSNEGSET